jgi:hypothetical protein
VVYWWAEGDVIVFVSILRSLGNMASGFAGAVFLGLNIQGFLLGLAICAFFNFLVELLTNREFASEFFHGLFRFLVFIGKGLLALLIPVVVMLGVQLIALAVYKVSNLPQSDAIFITIFFIVLLVIIVIAVKSTNKK